MAAASGDVVNPAWPRRTCRPHPRSARAPDFDGSRSRLTALGRVNARIEPTARWFRFGGTIVIPRREARTAAAKEDSGARRRTAAQNARMADINATCVTAADGWLCQVTVADQGSVSRHAVTLTRADFQRLASSSESPEGLVHRSFEFLLGREGKESILRSFALTDIGRYFPEYEREIGKAGADA
jgi:hypothetical protein